MKRPVLILGNEPRVALTIARSLYARGVPVDVASLTDDAPRLASRAVRRHLCVPGQLDRPDEFREPLEERIAEAGYDTLIPSSDTALALVSGCYEALSRRLHVGCPSPAVLRRVLDKDQTLEIARSVGILTPESYPIADASQLEAIRDRLRFPVVAKDRSKSLMQSSTFKVRYFSTYDALVSAFREDPGLGSRVLFQEYCPGVGVGVAMLMRNGEALAAFQHRRLKELPVTGGVAVMAISERLDPELARQSLVLLRTLEWEGVGMVEFRHDRSTGRPVLMEVNGRYWGTCSLAIACGLDFPYNQWQVLHGQGPDVPPSYRTGVTWRWTAGYLQRLHELVAMPVADNLPRPSAWREILGSAADLGPWNRSAVGSLRDPVPGLLEVGRTALALLAGD
ncbi:MAG TPA: ATP-grasp domain-containing protein, partial [Isosphaeraceae bacterium]|nr:ATP-grasp domain-containing protein [Isosphaeraceae bacterium]